MTARRKLDTPSPAPKLSATGWQIPAIQTKEQQVAEILREKIFTGAIGRGQKLKQAEIAKMLNISITPVREALKLLEAQGYVHVTAHRGAVVAPLQIEQVDELYQLRLLLEGRLTLAAAKRATAADIQKLATLNTEFGQALSRKNRAGVQTADFQFHFRLYDLADMPQTHDFVRILWAKYPFDLIGVVPRRDEHALREHQAVIEALRNTPPRKTMQAMQSHIENGYRAFTATYAR